MVIRKDIYEELEMNWDFSTSRREALHIAFLLYELV